MKIALADVNQAGLEAVGAEVTRIVGDPNNVLVIPTDVSKLEEVVHLRDKVYDQWGEVSSQHSAVYSARLPVLFFHSPAHYHHHHSSRIYRPYRYSLLHESFHHACFTFLDLSPPLPTSLPLSRVCF